MYKHILATMPDGAVQIIGLDYFNMSHIRQWTRPGELSKGGTSTAPTATFIQPDGTVLPISCPDDDLFFSDGKAVCNETTEDFLQRVIKTHIPADAVSYEIIDVRTWAFPPDRIFRDAWSRGNQRIDVDMNKARSIHMAEIRTVRNTELAARDITWMRAVEAGDTNAQATIAAEKQTLRDIPQTFDLTARTPSQLQAKWPLELPPRAG